MKKLITENDVLKLYKDGNRVLFIGSDFIITPLAKDKIRELKIEISYKKQEELNKEITTNLTFIGNLKCAIGSDHTGFFAKEIVKKMLVQKGYLVSDVGTYSDKSCDYPDFAFEVAKKVATGETNFGILLDATGIPSAITANKLPGIRAATCYNEFSARSSREHNNSNILVLGAKMLGEELIKSIIEIYLSSKFLGERHQKRLDKIDKIEKYFLSNSLK
ncbi:MAG TPA: ribose 5-phosphate isomerase B [Melioribacteraceae bacterium]|nr:ribose 5-phosphate isomerase B [Melioribacteraceae bacterium]